MSWLSPSKPKQVTPITNDISATGEKYPEHIEVLAAESEPKAWAQAINLEAKFSAEYNEDKAGFSFACQRRGDFLTVTVQRGKTEPNVLGDKPRLFSSSLNLSAVRDIQLTEGHAPDRLGSIGFSIAYRDKTGGGRRWGSSQGMYAPDPGDWWEVESQVPWLPVPRLILTLESATPTKPPELRDSVR